MNKKQKTNNQSNFKFLSVCFKLYIIFNAKLLLNKYISILLYLKYNTEKMEQLMSQLPKHLIASGSIRSHLKQLYMI